METKDFKAFYTDDTGNSVEGVFKLRRVSIKTTTDLLALSRKRVMRDGKEVTEDDNAMATRVWLASHIHDCPVVIGGQPWVQCNDILAKEIWVGEKLDEDMFAYLSAAAKSMHRLSKETENLYQASSQ
jgi:hypothetical protein